MFVSPRSLVHHINIASVSLPPRLSPQLLLLSHFLGLLETIFTVLYFGMYHDTRCNLETSVMTSMIPYLSSIDHLDPVAGEQA